MKLARQIRLFGSSTDGMPTIWVTEGKGGLLVITDGVTRATRVAKLCPKQTVRVEIIEAKPNLDFSSYPKIGDRIP